MRDVAEIEISNWINRGYEVTQVDLIDVDGEDITALTEELPEDITIGVRLKRVKNPSCYNITVNLPAGVTPEMTGREILKAIKEYEKNGGVEYR